VGGEDLHHQAGGFLVEGVFRGRGADRHEVWVVEGGFPHPQLHVRHVEAAPLPAGQGIEEVVEVAHDEVMGPVRPGHGVGDALQKLVLNGGGGLQLQVGLRGKPL
jgi:hypothetical protein